MPSRNTNWQRYAIIAKRAQVLEEGGATVPVPVRIADIMLPLCELRELEREKAGEFSSDFASEAELLQAKIDALITVTIRVLASARQAAIDFNESLTPQHFTRLAKNLRVLTLAEGSSTWEDMVLRTAGLGKLLDRPEVFRHGLVDLVVLLGIYADDNNIDLNAALYGWTSSLPWTDDE